MKELYKNLLWQLVVAVSLFNLVSCQEFHIDSQEVGESKLEIDAKESYLFTFEPVTFTFNLSSGTLWKIESDQQWCTVTPVTSSFSSLVEKITVSLEANEGWKERVATLTITAEGTTEDRVISVKQAGHDGFVVTPFEGEIPQIGGIAEFYIVASKTWEISGASDYLTFDKESGVGNDDGIIETIRVTVAPNPGAARIGTFAIKTATRVETFSIKQEGMKLELANPAQSVISLTKSDKQTFIDIISNVDWEVTTADDDWITASKVNSGQLELTYKSNKLFIERIGKVIVRSKQIDAEPIEIAVTQANDIYTIANSAMISFDNKTGWITVAGTAPTSTVNIQNLFQPLPYKFSKGHITIEFEEVKLKDEGASLFFNFDGAPVSGARLTFRLNQNNKGIFVARIPKSIGGSEQGNKEFTLNEELKKIEFIQQTKLTDETKSIFRLLINGKLAQEVEEINGWEETLQFGMYIQACKFTNQDCFVIKSVEYEPYD